MTAGQVSDYTGAAALLDEMPKAQWLLGDRGYDADWFRDAFQAKGIRPCIPGRRSRNEPVRYDERRYRRRNRIKIMFSRLKDRRRVASRYDRRPTVFFSAIALAATSFSGCDQRVPTLFDRLAPLAVSGVNVIVLLALTDTGRPSYDPHPAGRAASLSIPVFACTPEHSPN